MTLLQVTELVTATARLVRGKGCRTHLLNRGATEGRQASCYYVFALITTIGVGRLENTNLLHTGVGLA